MTELERECGVIESIARGRQDMIGELEQQVLLLQCVPYLLPSLWTSDELNSNNIQ